MNAGLMILRDGTPCLVYDEDMPYPIRHFEFDRTDFQISIVFATPEDGEIKVSRKLEYPLDNRFVNLLEERGTLSAARVKGGKMAEIKGFLIKFVN